MQYSVAFSKEFKKQYKKLKYSGNIRYVEELDKVIKQIASGVILLEKYRNHKLSGQMHDKFECHVVPDLLLIYKKDEDVLVLELIATGSHSELF